MTTQTDCKQRLIEMVNNQVDELEADPFDEMELWLDINYLMDSRRSFLGATVVTATGGPHIEFNTRYNKVTGYWGRDTIERHYKDNSDIHGYLEEQFNAIK